jgi:hypothetical protein
MTSASASRVTRSSRSLRIAIILAAGVVAGIAVLHAQEAPPAPRPSPAASAPVAEDEKPVPPGGEEAATPGTSTPREPAGASPGRFEPTEKVRADFDVSFPIDI